MRGENRSTLGNTCTTKSRVENQKFSLTNHANNATRKKRPIGEGDYKRKERGAIPYEQVQGRVTFFQTLAV